MRQEDEPLDPAKSAYELGRLASREGNHGAAVGFLAESARLDPHFKTLELWGESLLALGRPGEAIVPLAAATTLNKQGRAPALLAKALVVSGAPEKAREMAQLALERAPGNKLAIEVLAQTTPESDGALDHQ